MAYLWHPIPSQPGYIGICSGTVVSSNVVLTAAHCVVDESTGFALPANDFHVYTGSVDVSAASESAVSRVIPDPNYDPTEGTNDIALLVLSAPITSPSVALADSTDQYLDEGGTGAYIAGWGDTYSGQQTATNALQWAPTVVQDGTWCAYNELSPDVFDPALNLCSINYPYDDTSTCQGDSGGPLVATDATGQWVEIGVTDYGAVGCSTQSADFFASVLGLRSWIESWISAVAVPQSTVVKFTKWHVYVKAPSGQAWTTSPPGATLGYCSSAHVIHLWASYIASGPSSGPVVQRWYRNGGLWDSFHDSRLGSSGEFGINTGPGDVPIRTGSWVVQAVYGNQVVGSMSIRLKHPC